MKPAPEKPGRLDNQRGASLIELAMVIAALGLVTAAVLRFSIDSKKGLIGFENKSELIKATQRISENIRGSVNSASMLLINYESNSGTSTVGLNYSNLIANSIAATVSQAPPPVAFSVAPLAKTSDQLNITDAAAQAYIGNRLDFAANVPPIKLYYNATAGNIAYDKPSEAPGGAVVEEVQIARIQFVSLYLAHTENTLGAVGNGVLGLVEWRSVPLISKTSLDWMPAAKRTAVTARLLDKGYTLVWQTGEIDSANAFFTLNLTPVAAPGSLGERSWAYTHQFVRIQDYHAAPTNLGRVQYGSTGTGVSGFSSFYSMAYNTGGTLPQLSVNKLFSDGKEIEVPRFAAANAAGFPGGFEVFVTGTLGNRKVYAFVTMMAVSAANLGDKAYYASHSLTLATVTNPL